MNPDFEVEVKRSPSVCSQNSVASTSPSQRPSRASRRRMGTRSSSIIRPRPAAPMANRRVSSAPTDRPAWRQYLVAGKPPPQMAAMAAMAKTAKRWDLRDSGILPGYRRAPFRRRRNREALDVLLLFQDGGPADRQFGLIRVIGGQGQHLAVPAGLQGRGQYHGQVLRGGLLAQPLHPHARERAAAPGDA